jgi:NitT/TauT family transport system substrate-binding protein
MSRRSTPRSQQRPARRVGRAALVAAGALALVAAGLSGCSASSASASGGGTPALRLGYFPNLTHAAAIAGVQKGFFKDALGSSATLTTATFNAGPAATEALFANAIDASFIGPNPTINAYAKSKGAAIRVIAGATSGGAALVVKPGINTVADLRGKQIATPQLGNTQDVALRYYLKQNGLHTDTQGGGDVNIVPEDNGTTLTAFAAGKIDGAWVPEPYATRLVQESGGKVLVNEATLWPQGKFVTTDLVVRTDYLNAHPDVIKKLLEGLVKATDYVNTDPAAPATVNDGLKTLSGKALKPAVLAAAWKNLTFTVDPLAAPLKESAKHAEDVGLLDPIDLSGLYDLGPLNAVLAAAGKAPVSAS